MKPQKFHFSVMLVTGAVAAAMSMRAMPASASMVTLYTFNSGQPNAIYYGSIDFNVGNEVTVGTNSLSVTSIGAFVESSIGSTQAYITADKTTLAFTAYIYSTTSNSAPLDAVTIPVGTTVDAQGFAYVPLTTTLSANTTYLLTDAANGSATPFAYNSLNALAGTFSGATFVQNVYQTTPTAYPSANNGSLQDFMGANLQYSAVPEPASLGLCAVGAMGLLLLRKRNRRAV